MAPAATVRRTMKSASRKAQLIEVAAKIFLEKGYKEAGIESILKQAGLTGPALYRHFSSKQEILDTICINAAERTLEVATELQHEEGRSPNERLEKLIDYRLDYLFSPAGSSSFLMVSQRAHISDDARDKVLAMQREFGDIFSSLLKEIRPDLNEDELLLIFFSVQNMVLYSIWRARDRAILPPDEHKTLLRKLIWSTLMA